MCLISYNQVVLTYWLDLLLFHAFKLHVGHQKGLLWFSPSSQQRIMQSLSHSSPLFGGMGRRIRRKRQNSRVGIKTA